jgi:phage-related minor tail protein
MKIVLLSLIIFASLQAGASSERAGKKRLEQLRTEMKKEEKAERRKIENQKKEEEKVERQKAEEKAERQKAEEKAERQKEEEKVERQKEEEKVERQKEEEKAERQKAQTSLEEVPVVIMEEEIMPIKEAEKATVSKRELYKKRRELNESIEERVFKSSKDLKTKIEVTKETYKLGKDRIDFLLEEENQLISLEKAIGIEKKPSETVYLNKKYDEIGEKIKKSNSVSEILMLENEKLESYLERLDGMEKELKNKM